LSIILEDNGKLWIFGDNTYSQSANGRSYKENQPTLSFQSTPSSNVFPGYYHTIIINKENSPMSLGRYIFGQLGYDINSNVHYPTNIPINKKIKKAAAGENFSLVIDEDNHIWSWGLNYQGQLGHWYSANTFNGYSTPIKISNIKFKEVVAGQKHVLAIDETGQLWAWGSNSDRQVGNDSKYSTASLTQINNGIKYEKISSFWRSSYAIDENGQLWAWGNSENYQLGNGWKSTRSSPIKVLTNKIITNVFAGAKHVLALDNNNTLWAWGLNENGQLGIDKNDYVAWSPSIVSTENNIDTCAAGAKHTLLLDKHGKLWVTGDNTYGQLGLDNKENIFKPTFLMQNIKYIACGAYNSFAIDSLENIWVWGRNSYGQLGLNGGVINTKPTHVNYCYNKLEIISDFDTPQCPGKTVKLYTSNYFANHHWSTGEKKDTIEVNKNSIIKLTAGSNNNCLKEWKDSIIVNFLELPELKIHSNLDMPQCEGIPIQLHISEPFKNANWSNGLTHDTIIINNPGKYNVIASDSFGCKDNWNASIDIEYYNLPEQPEIFHVDNLIYSSWKDSNIWFLDGNKLDITNDTITLSSSGLYTAQAINKHGCLSPLSNKMEVTITNNDHISNNIIIQPNPADDYIHITGIPLYHNNTICLYDINGTLLKKLKLNSPEILIDISSLKTGTYIVVLNNQFNESRKILKK
jgi:alpha-tubulin suppressor-like RCC1 family protein